MDTDAFDRRQVARAFGAVLKSARTRKGLSQNALCDAANMDYTYPSLLCPAITCGCSVCSNSGTACCW